MIKICFVTNNISSIGGQQRVVSSVANILSQNDKIDVSILFTSNEESAFNHQYELSDKISIMWDENLVRTKYKYLRQKLAIKFYQYIYKIKNVDLAIKLMFSKSEIKAYEKFFKENKFDVIIGVAPFPSAIISMINAPGKKVGWLQSTFERYFETKHDYMWNEADIYTHLLSNLDEVIVLTDSAKEKFAIEMAKKPKRIYNPLSFEHKQQSKLDNNKLIFMGRLVYTPKGLAYLIKILQKLKSRGVEFEIDILGDGPDYRKFIDEVNNSGLQNNVNLIGATNEVEKYLLNSSICVVPSIVEGFGLVVTEALECGVPVISFDTEGPKEIITDGKDGYIIEKFNIEKFVEKIIFLFENRNELRNMGKEAKLKAISFSKETISQEWYELLLELKNN